MAQFLSAMHTTSRIIDISDGAMQRARFIAPSIQNPPLSAEARKTAARGRKNGAIGEAAQKPAARAPLHKLTVSLNLIFFITMITAVELGNGFWCWWSAAVVSVRVQVISQLD